MGQFSSVPSSTSSIRPICVFCLDTNNVKQCNHPRCKSCDIRFETYELFVSHKNEKHPQCELCNEVFENKEMFDAHYVLCKEKHEIKCLEIANKEKIKIEKQKELKSIRQKEFDKKQPWIWTGDSYGNDAAWVMSACYGSIFWNKFRPFNL